VLSSSSTKIPVSSIVYIQVGTERLPEAHENMVEPEKPFNASPASIYISAGGDSVRIRLPGEEAAAIVAKTLRLAMEGHGSMGPSTHHESTRHDASSSSEGGLASALHMSQHAVHEVEDGINEVIANTGREVRRSVSGVDHQILDGVTDRLAHFAGREAPPHHADNRHAGSDAATAGELAAGECGQGKEHAAEAPESDEHDECVNDVEDQSEQSEWHPGLPEWQRLEDEHGEPYWQSRKTGIIISNSAL
jgi:hypothetical protein